MKKRVVSFVMLLVMALSLVALPACGGNSGNNKTAESNFIVPEGGYDGSAVTIKFYHTMGSKLTTVLDAYIEEFNALYPNITIEYTTVGNYDDVRDQISTEITVGAQPNIAYCYPDHVALYNLAGHKLDNLHAVYA